MNDLRDRDPWIHPVRRHSASRLRLFCFPYAGGGTAWLRAWADALPSVEVCAVRLPGRETRLREPPFRRLRLLVDALVPSLMPWLDMPYALAGHSLGALLAFETARALRRAGARTPERLILLGRGAPDRRSRLPQLHTLPDRDFLAAVQSRYGGIPQAVLAEPELVEMILPILRADFELLDTYALAPEPPLDCPLFVYGGAQDSLIREEDLAAWRQHTSSDFSLRLLPGGHFFPQSPASGLLPLLATTLLGQPEGHSLAGRQG